MKTIKGLKILGTAASFQVRIGNKTEKLTHQGGFERNPLCFFHNGITRESIDIRCERARIGQIISVHVVDPLKISKLQLCDLEYY